MNRPELQWVSWGDGAEVPAAGKDLVIVGTDGEGLLHVRIFGADGGRITDADETTLPPKRAGAIRALKRQLAGMSPPRELTGYAKRRVLRRARFVAGRTDLDSITFEAALAAVALVVAIAAGAIIWRVWPNHHAAGNQAPLTQVRFGMLPYGDHTYAIIGVKKGWFKEAGIELDYQVIRPDEAVAFLKNGSLDVASGNPGLCFAAYETMPGVGVFVVGSVFQGYAVMAQPGGNYASYDELVARGREPSEAIKATAAQLRGKVFAYPSEAAVKPFLDLVVDKGGLSPDAFKPLVLDDTLTVNAMRNKQADFQVGGAPSRLVLQREGFKPILTSKDLAAAARPSPESRELSVLFPDGWMTTAEYFEKNRDVVLRLASVNFRILRFMKDHREEALRLHMNYLSQVTGQTFTPVEGAIIYDSLDPFYTFEAQEDWYHDPKSVYYFRNLNGAILRSFVAQKIYRRRTPEVEDAVYADDVYNELGLLKVRAERLFRRIEASGVTDRDPGTASTLATARKYFDAYNYLDSVRLAREVALH